MADDTPVAILDFGTNTTRLLITNGTSVDIRTHRITGLGRGLGKTDRLSEEGIGRVLDAVDEFKSLISENGAQRIRAVATSAARDAVNRADLFEPVSAALNHELELLSGEEEARYGFLGATAGLPSTDGPFLVIDIGGGSTEFSYGTHAAEIHRSVDMGSVRFMEQFFINDPPKPEELSGAIQVARLHLDDIDRDHAIMGTAKSVVGVAGTITTIAAVEIGLEPYDPQIIDGFVLSRRAAEDVFRTLATESLEIRKYNPGLEAARADVIVAGCCILVAVMRHWELEECLVRESDLLDGLAFELLAVE
ncbi:MAG: exopolyphosphatase [Acidimicrobiales bacterium]|nr:MAG: exopolyphosphatase [Acidimicrobiales bacterium]